MFIKDGKVVLTVKAIGRQVLTSHVDNIELDLHVIPYSSARQYHIMLHYSQITKYGMEGGWGGVGFTGIALSCLLVGQGHGSFSKVKYQCIRTLMGV